MHNPLLRPDEDSLGKTVFRQTENDNQLALSIGDVLFRLLMEADFFKDSSDSWVAPLPFRKPRRLPRRVHL